MTRRDENEAVGMKRWWPFKRGEDRTWRPVDVWVAIGVGAVFVTAVAILISWSVRWYAEEGVTYVVDIGQTRDKLSWTTSYDPELEALLEVDLGVGEACEVPAGREWRGVILRGRDLHGRVRQYRIFKDHYIIEYRNGDVRCVEDSAPWGPVSEMLWTMLPPPLLDFMVDEGMMDPR